MSKEERHSAQQMEAAEAQSDADITGRGKAQASALQSAADQAAMKKHGKSSQ